MAQITNAYRFKDHKTAREDLSDTVYNIDPWETPFMNFCAGKRKVSNTTFDWSQESLQARNTATEQDSYVVNPAVTPGQIKLNNVINVMKRDSTLGHLAQAANVAGIKNPHAHSMALRAKELRIDMEKALLSKNPRLDDTGTNNPVTRGFEHFITTNVSAGTGYVAPTDQYTALTDGTVRSFAQWMLEDALQTAFDLGATPKNVLVGGYSKRRVSSFQGRGGTHVVVSPNELLVGFDVYQSDFGTLKIMPARELRARTVLGISKDECNVPWYDMGGGMFNKYDLAKTGAADTKVIECAFGLEVGTERAHFKIADLPATRAADPTPLT